jgi:uncharacterized protein (TIGR02246 family)
VAGVSPIRTENIASAIADLRELWLDAVKSADAVRLAELVTDDVVVVHGNGRSVRGKAQLKSDFQNAFDAFSIEQRVTNPEVVVRGGWALEISAVDTRLVPRPEGEPIAVASTTVVVFQRQPDGSWKIARVLGLLDGAAQPPAE